MVKEGESVVRVVDEALLACFRGPGICSWCRKWVSYRQPHHLFCRGMGAGSRLDVRINLAALCAPFSGGDDCHQRTHTGEIQRHDLLAIVAAREGRLQDDVEREIFKLLRTPKGKALGG